MTELSHVFLSKASILILLFYLKSKYFNSSFDNANFVSMTCTPCKHVSDIFKSAYTFIFILWFKISNISNSILFTVICTVTTLFEKHSDYFNQFSRKIIVWVTLQFGTIDDSIVVIFRHYNICLVFCPRHKPWILKSENSCLIPLSRIAVDFETVLRLW